MKSLLLLCCVFVDGFQVSVPAEATTWRETQWSAYLAESVGGTAEFVCPDGSRADIVDDTTAWEVEWSDKWPQAVGQAVLYSIHTEKQAGIWLLRRKNDDEHYLRCVATVEHLRGKGIKIAFRQQRTW